MDVEKLQLATFNKSHAVTRKRRPSPAVWEWVPIGRCIINPHPKCRVHCQWEYKLAVPTHRERDVQFLCTRREVLALALTVWQMGAPHLLSEWSLGVQKLRSRGS